MNRFDTLGGLDLGFREVVDAVHAGAEAGKFSIELRVHVQGGLGCTLFTVKGRPTVSAKAIAWFSIPAWPGVNTQQGFSFSDDVNLEPI